MTSNQKRPHESTLWRRESPLTQLCFILWKVKSQFLTHPPMTLISLFLSFVFLSVRPSVLPSIHLSICSYTSLSILPFMSRCLLKFHIMRYFTLGFIGNGNLTLPYAVAHAGLLPGTIGIVFCGFAFTYCVHCLIAASRWIWVLAMFIHCEP